MALTCVRTKLGWLIIALVALAVIAAACSSSDDEDAGGQPEAAAQAEESSDDQAQSPADDEVAPELEERDQAQAQADAQDQGEVQAEVIEQSEQVGSDDEESGAPSSEEQAADQAEAEAAEQAQAQAEADTETESANASDGVAAGASSVGLGDLAAVQDLRFEGVISLELTPNTAGGDFDLSAFGDITLDGGFVAPGDFELAIRLGDGAGFPPIGIISLGDTLYTNLGFGWDAQEGGAGGLLDLFGGLVDTSAFGVDADALDVESVGAGGLAGLGGLLPEDFSLENWDEGGSEDLSFGPATRYTIETTSLEEFIERLLGDSAASLADADVPIDLSALEDVEASADRADISVWIDEATGTLAALSLVLENLVIVDIDDEGNELTLGLVSLRIDLNPEFGLPVDLVVIVEDLVIEGPDGASGDVRIDFRIFDINEGSVEIEAPI